MELNLLGCEKPTGTLGMLVGCTALATLDLVDCDKIEGSDLRFAICLNPSKDSAPAALQGLLPPVSAKPQKPGLGRPWLALAGLVRVLFEQPRILPRSNPTPQFESAQRFCSPFFEERLCHVASSKNLPLRRTKVPSAAEGTHILRCCGTHTASMTTSRRRIGWL